MDSEQTWYSFKCVFRHPHLADALSQPLEEGEVLYEERVVILKASTFLRQ